MKTNPTDDIEEIRLLKPKYGDVIDRIVRDRQPGDEDLLEALFTDDAILHFESALGRHEGLDAIVRFFVEDLPAATRWMWHSFHSPLITVDGDTAEGRWTLYALAVGNADPTAPPRATYGRYIDRYVRTADGWKIQHQYFLDETRS